jgi:hypothetical protein
VGTEPETGTGKECVKMTLDRESVHRLVDRFLEEDAEIMARFGVQRSMLVTPELVEWHAEPILAHDWDTAFQRTEKRHHLDLLSAVHEAMTDAEYWRTLGEIWTLTEGPGRNRAFWVEFFLADRGEREHLMEPEDHAALAQLPDSLKIYRGACPRHARGLSWTMDLPVAAWYADRFSSMGQAYILSATLPKRKVLAYFNTRHEYEVVIDARRIRYEILPWTDEEIADAAKCQQRRTIEFNNARLLELRTH